MKLPLLSVALAFTAATALAQVSDYTQGSFVSGSGGGGGGGHAARNSHPSAGATAAPTNPDHVLQPEDVIEVQVFQEDDINDQCQNLHVSNDSTIMLPLIGSLSVKGKTIEQVRREIAARYNKDFIVNPQVAITVVQYADRQVNVIGSVSKQGRIDFPSQRDLTIVDAIALAGGQTRLADLKHVKLTRVNENGESEMREIDVNAMMKGSGATPVLLQPGDVIYVPERML